MRGQRCNLVGCVNRVQMHAGNRQAGDQRQVSLQATEVGGQQEFDWRGSQRVVGLLEGQIQAAGQFGDQNRFIDLHPLHTFGSQRVK